MTLSMLPMGMTNHEDLVLSRSRHYMSMYGMLILIGTIWLFIIGMGLYKGISEFEVPAPEVPAPSEPVGVEGEVLLKPPKADFLQVEILGIFV